MRHFSLYFKGAREAGVDTSENNKSSADLNNFRLKKQNARYPPNS
jgi:hypothetical protein